MQKHAGTNLYRGPHQHEPTNHQTVSYMSAEQAYHMNLDWVRVILRGTAFADRSKNANSGMQAKGRHASDTAHEDGMHFQKDGC